MILGITIGLLVWFVVPMCFQTGKRPSKRRRRLSKRDRIVAAACRIVGIVIIVASVLKQYLL